MKSTSNHTVESIRALLQEVKDPEIPTISLIDLGVITDIDISEDQTVLVRMTPTFAGCPAMDYMKNNVIEVLEEHGILSHKVEMNFDVAWTTNNITSKGLAGIKAHGLAPPPKHDLIIDIELINKSRCPSCDSVDTEMKSPFGPTLCRSLHYCNNCLQAFERFKPL